MVDGADQVAHIPLGFSLGFLKGLLSLIGSWKAKKKRRLFGLASESGGIRERAQTRKTIRRRMTSSFFEFSHFFFISIIDGWSGECNDSW